MKGKERKKIGVKLNKMLGEIRYDFYKCSLTKNLVKGKFGKLLQ
jgi:hypothetical protein